MITDENVTERTKLEKYLKRQGRDNLVTELQCLSSDQLKERLLKQALYKQEQLTARGNDSDLAQAKEIARDMAAIYNDNIRMGDKIARFINLILEDQNKV